MTKTNNSTIWTEEGYKLFAREGLEGIQIERLARILNLNKSGFYHYFGDLESFYDELLKLHEKKAELYIEAVEHAQTIDPDYFQILIEFSESIMFHMQLTRIKNRPAFSTIVGRIDQKRDVVVRQIWSAYLGVEDNPDLAMRYFYIIRDMFFARISIESFNEPFLRNLLGEAKALINDLKQSKSELEDKSLF